MVKEYLLQLRQSNLIEYTEGDRTFKTTPKGMQALQMYSRMDALLVKEPQV
jgi:predicted transcriptional regulator